jgi:hypothetical protein
VVGSGEGRDRAARAIVAEARRRGHGAVQVAYVAPTPERRLSRPAAAVWATVAVARGLAALAVWRLRYGRRLVVVTGHWYDAFGGPDRAASRRPVDRDDDDARALRASRPLWPLLPRADLAVVLDDEGRRDRHSSDDWRPWMWLHAAPWFADRVIVGRADGEAAATATARRSLDALAVPPSDGYRWAATPIAPARLRARATVGPSAAAACAVNEPIRGRRVVPRLNAALLAVGAALPDVPPVDGLPELCRTLGVEPDGLASVSTKKPGRLVIGVAAQGELRLVVKIALAGDEGLRLESDVLARADGSINGVRVPIFVWAGEWRGRFVVATVGVPRHTKADDATPRDVLDLCLRLAGAGGEGPPVVHGDLAPWNILVPVSGSRGAPPVLVDWEHARDEDDPLHDLAHFASQRGWLLRRASPAEVVADLVEPHSTGWRYLEARGLDPTGAPAHVGRYLDRAFDLTPFHHEMRRLLPG